ncbi:MAG: hypothetical protein WCO05_05085 [Candidatus Moraniibacteriota bacterium]
MMDLMKNHEAKKIFNLNFFAEFKKNIVNANPRYISLEGVDGAGKTRAAEFICDYLAEHGLIDPDGKYNHIISSATLGNDKTEIGKFIEQQIVPLERKMINDPVNASTYWLERDRLYAERIVEMFKMRIAPKLLADEYVVTDRAADTTILTRPIENYLKGRYTAVDDFEQTLKHKAQLIINGGLGHQIPSIRLMINSSPRKAISSNIINCVLPKNH